MPVDRDRRILTRPAQFHPSVLKAMEMVQIEPGYLLLSISSMLSMLNNTMENCLLFGGYALAKEIVTSDACIETVQVLHQVLSKIRLKPSSQEDKEIVVDLKDADGFRTMADFLSETLDMLRALKEGKYETDQEVVNALNRFRDSDIPQTLRAIFAVIRGEKTVSDAIFENVALRELSLTVIHEDEAKLLLKE